MRLKPGRPDLTRHARRFDVAAVGPQSRVAVTWAGVSTLLIDDGSTAVLTDGYFSRPGLARVALGRVAPDPARIDGCLVRLGVRRLAAVIPVHTHIDHALDSAVVAEKTGAALVGGRSAAQLGAGHGLPADDVVVAEPGEPLTFGSFELTLVESRHCPPDRFPGAITAPVVPPVRASAYRCGETWSALIGHRPSGQRLLVQGSAGFIPGALAGHRAEVVYLGIGQLGRQPRSYLVDYWAETVRAVGGSTVVLVHWDDFFYSLSKPLRALPYAVDDVDFSVRVLAELAERDGVTLSMPRLWRPEDPWA
ncbi:MBL fold metallo-hydrolase [Mycolicibacillus trivialis]